MKIISKSKAESMLLDSLFKPLNGKTLSKDRFDSGKYAGKVTDFYGKEAPDIDGVVCIFPECRSDRNGKYIALCCYSTH